MRERYEGTIKFVQQNGAWGIITLPTEEQEVFFPACEYRGDFSTLRRTDAVTFEFAKRVSRGRKTAVRVQQKPSTSSTLNPVAATPPVLRKDRKRAVKVQVVRS